MFALPAAASAMAAVAPAAAAKFSLMATLKTVALNVLTNVALSAAMSAFQPQVGSGGRTFEFVIDPDGPIPFAAGRIGVAGSVIHRDTFGPDLMYYGIPAVLSGAGPITAIEAVRADDYPQTFDANGGATVEPYNQELFFRSVLGHQPAPVALSTPAGLKHGSTLPGWTAAHKLSGKAAFLMVMAENSKGSAFPTGEVKPLVTLVGLKGWDPTKDSTYPGGVGTCRLNDPSTWVTLTCPILWALKWALGLWEGPTLKGAPAHGSSTDFQVGGIGAKLAGIDVPAFVNASNIAKANNWTVSAYPNTDDDKHEVLKTFLQAGGAIYSQRAGKISCISRAAPRTSIVTISAADTAGPLEIDTAASRIDRINTLRPRFWSPAHRWQMTALDGEVTAASYRTEDGGVRTRGIDYPYVSNAKQAAQLAALQIANTREGIAGVIPLKPHMQRIRPGDAFTITEQGFVLNGLKCLCLNTDYDPSTGIVRVSFVSETDAKYPFALGQNPVPPEPQVLTPVDPRTVSPPTPGDWVITLRPPAPGGGQQPGFDLTGVVSNDTATAIIVETGPSATGPWAQAYQGPPTVTTIPVDGLQPGATYFIAVQYQRNQNYSARYVYGPYVAPDLISDDTQNVGGVASDLLNARLVSAEALAEAAHDAAEEILSGYPSIMDAIADAIEARDASLVAAESADGSATAAAGSAAVAGVSADEAEERALAALGHATSAGASAGQADTYQQQASEAAEDAVSASLTAGTAADTATGAAGTATAQASAASGSATSAAASASVAASLGSNNANPNSRFANWTGTAPASWSLWTPANGALSKATGRNGQPNAARISNTGTGNVGLLAGQTRATSTGGEYVVLSVELTLVSGSLQGAGVYFDARSPASSVNYVVHNLAAIPDATGTVRGAGVAGRTYRWSILRDARGTDVDRYDLIGLNRWSGFSPAGAAVIDWHVLGWRPATPEEIAAGVALPALSASVTTVSEAVADLEDQSALARFQVAATSPGGAAILSLLSDVHGTVAGLMADKIYFGENTFFDDATDTLRTTSNGVRSVLALGASFGTDGQLREWMGPDTVAFSAISRANAYFYRAHATPYVGGSGLPSAGASGGALLKSASTSNNTSNNTTWVAWASVAFAALPTGGMLKATVNTSALAITISPTTLFSGNWRIRQGATVLWSGSFLGDSAAQTADIIVPAAAKASVASGATSLVLEIQRASGTSNITGGVDVYLEVQWVAGG
ncbi:hypothetical protein [Brevundimonas sp. GCM10030266]|uniref:hypothetical protein n=1 Tax=Brevundimonas sp. GCM10030266 TaxID=3273386 RepID=UPI00360AABC4